MNTVTKVGLAALFAAAIACAAFVWLYALAASRNADAALEFAAYRRSSILLETYLENGSADPGERGAFAVYDPRGQLLFSKGDVPATLDPMSVRMDTFIVEKSDGIMSIARAYGRTPDLPPPAPFQPAPGLGRMQGRAGFIWLSVPMDLLGRDGEAPLGMAVLVTVMIAIASILGAWQFRRAEALREKTARDEELVALGEAARTLAHEIRNPLGVIRIQCANLRRETGSEGVALVEEEVDRLSRLTDRVRDFLRAETPEPGVVPLDRIVSDAKRRWGERVSAQGAELRALADEHVLVDALDNLVRNALESGEATRVTLRAERRGGKVVVAVEDDGPGIPGELRRRLFEPFFTTKPDGSGIGLALSRKRIRSMGGDIRHVDRKQGCEFVVELKEARDRDATVTASGS